MLSLLPLEIVYHFDTSGSHRWIQKRQTYATQKATLPFALPQGKQAIINVWDFPREVWNLFTLWKSCPTHHRGLIWFRISDRKFVNHTTEMILWSMILVDAWKISGHIRWQHKSLFESLVYDKVVDVHDIPKVQFFILLEIGHFCHSPSRLRLSLYIVSSKGFSLGWPSEYEFT